MNLGNFGELGASLDCYFFSICLCFNWSNAIDKLVDLRWVNFDILNFEQQ
jgi:hypothetical protein